MSIRSTKSTMGPNLLSSFREHYIKCIKRGSIQLHSGKGWYTIQGRKHIMEALEKFSEEDRKEILKGIKIYQQTEEKKVKEITNLLQQIPTEEVELLIKELSQ